MASSTTLTAMASFAPALTTTFIALPECTSYHLTQLSSPGYQIWLNEPVPVPGTTFSDCYPSQWLEDYTSVSFSSIVSALSPLVDCPGHWTKVFQSDLYRTEFSRTDEYIACCPVSYSLHTGPGLDSGRPAYGGTCYSDFSVGQTVQITAYDSESVTATVDWIASTAGAQAYAHVIDGFLAHDNSSQPHSSRPGSPGPTIASEPSLNDGSSVGLERDAVIAIAVVCSVCGAALLGAIAWFAVRGRQQLQITEIEGTPKPQLLASTSTAEMADTSKAATFEMPT